MHGDNTALSAGELAAFQEECNKETVRFGMKTLLTIEKPTITSALRGS